MADVTTYYLIRREAVADQPPNRRNRSLQLKAFALDFCIIFQLFFYFHFFILLVVNSSPLLPSHSAARNVTRAENITLCIFPWPALDLLSDDKLLSYLSSLQNSLRLPTLIPPPVPCGGSIPPPPWHESFLRPPLWPPSARAAYALNPARRVNLPALIKIASFVTVSLSLSLSLRPLVPDGIMVLGTSLCSADSKRLTLGKMKVCSTILWWVGKKKSHIMLPPYLLALTWFPE